jgi:adenine-specific DNA-methyltransferase
VPIFGQLGTAECAQIATVTTMDGWLDTEVTEDVPGYLSGQLITCLGNKRALLGPVRDALGRVEVALGRRALRIFEPFSGSGAVSRLLKAHASHLVVNDLEAYAATVARCFLANRSTVDEPELHQTVERLNADVERPTGTPGFVERLYAPRDDAAIQPSERVFYTRENARRLDRYRTMIAASPPHLRDLLLGPLLSQASVHANTAGVFKGFYKDRSTGVGTFGGTGRDALSRIRGRITLEPPTLSRFECPVEIHCEDANALVGRVGEFDLAYFDPPYNEHPYGSNYFMLNLITTYVEPTAVSTVSGIPRDWKRSRYNSRDHAVEALGELVSGVHARFVLLAYNSEGFVAPSTLAQMLSELGPVSEVRTTYRAFRGSRNLRSRDPHVTEHLFLLEKSPAHR